MKDASMSLGIYLEIKDAGETAQMMARAFKESRCLDYEKTC